MNQKYILIDDQRRQNAINYLLGLELGKYQMEVKPIVKEKTDLQTHALFGVAYPAIMEVIGMRGNDDKEELHMYWCGEYFGWKEYSILGKKKVKPIRTTTRNEEGKRDLIPAKVMADMYSFIQQRCAENGIDVPDPDPLWFMNK